MLCALVLSIGGRAWSDTATKSDPDDDKAKAIVERWLAAQNAGDFAAYEALYAKKFQGTRRSGNKVVTLDRAGWMRDRKRMFKAPMKSRSPEATG